MAYMTILAPLTGAVRSDGIRRVQDDAFIPADPGNADWQAYETWLKAGNTPTQPGPAPDTSAAAKSQSPSPSSA